MVIAFDYRYIKTVGSPLTNFSYKKFFQCYLASKAGLFCHISVAEATVSKHFHNTVLPLTECLAFEKIIVHIRCILYPSNFFSASSTRWNVNSPRVSSMSCAMRSLHRLPMEPSWVW